MLYSLPTLRVVGLGHLLTPLANVVATYIHGICWEFHRKHKDLQNKIEESERSCRHHCTLGFWSVGRLVGVDTSIFLNVSLAPYHTALEWGTNM